MTAPQPQNVEKNENQHRSSQAHVPTFWSLLPYYAIPDYTILLHSKLYHTVPDSDFWKDMIVSLEWRIQNTKILKTFRNLKSSLFGSFRKKSGASI